MEHSENEQRERQIERENTISQFYVRMPWKCVQTKMIKIIHHAKCTSGATHLSKTFSMCVCVLWRPIQTIQWQKPRKQNSSPTKFRMLCVL